MKIKEKKLDPKVQEQVDTFGWHLLTLLKNKNYVIVENALAALDGFACANVDKPGNFNENLLKEICHEITGVLISSIYPISESSSYLKVLAGKGAAENFLHINGNCIAKEVVDMSKKEENIDNPGYAQLLKVISTVIVKR